MWLPTNNETQKSEQKGFTLIELIIVIALMGVVMSVSIASFFSFNKSQALQTGQLGVVNMLQEAKSEAESQVKPSTICTAAQALDGYQVEFTSATTYQLDVKCNGTATKVASKTLPYSISFNPTPLTFFFPVLHGIVTNGTITIQDQSSHTQWIKVDPLGNIQYSH